MTNSVAQAEAIIEASYLDKNGWDRPDSPGWRYRCGPTQVTVHPLKYYEFPQKWFGRVEFVHGDCHHFNLTTGEKRPLGSYVWSVETRAVCEAGFSMFHADGRCIPDLASVNPDLNGSTCPAGENTSNPIHSALGTKIQREVDFVLDGGFSLERTYLSKGSRSTGSFGWGWRNPVDRHVLPYFAPSSTTPNRLWIRFGPGDATTAVRGTDGTWVLESIKKDILVRDALVAGGPGIEIIDGRTGTALYTMDGKLQQFRPSSGTAFT